jgi:ParB family chromosome partitioning protein
MPETTPQIMNKKKSSLGRGLGSLLAAAEVDAAPPAQPSEGRPAAARPLSETQMSQSPSASLERAPGNYSVKDEAQIWTIPVDRLSPNAQQPRQVFSPEALKELSDSIKEKGILQPIVARRLGEREFEIIAGERRWRAAQAAGLHEVPVILKSVSEQDSLELAIIENIQRENLNAMEEAEAYDRLMIDYSLTQQQVADKLGKDRSSVANLLRLLSLPSELKLMVRSNQLSAGHAKVILGVEGKHTQIAIAKQVIDEKLSVRATEKLALRAKADARSASEPPKNGAAINLSVSQRLAEGLAAELQKLIGTKVVIDYSDSKGKLSIHFYSDDQLTQVVERLRGAWAK